MATTPANQQFILSNAGTNKQHTELQNNNVSFQVTYLEHKEYIEQLYVYMAREILQGET